MARVYFFQKWTLAILLFGSTLLFNPFINTDVFEFPKILALIVFVDLLMLINIIDISLFKPAKLKLRKISPEIFCMGVLLLTQIIAFVFSTDPQISLMGAPERYQGLLTNLHYLLLAINSFYFFAKNRKNGDKVFKLVVVILVIACLLAVLPYVFPLTFPFYFFTPSFFFGRVYGTFGNPNYLAVFIIAALPFLIFLKNFKKIYLYPLISLVVATLFLTGSRSAWIASIVSFLIIGTVLAVREKSYKTLIVTIVVIIFSGVAVLSKNIVAPVVPQFERLSLDSEKSTSIQTRLYLWQAGLKVFIEKPFTGYGQDMVHENIESYLPEYLKENDVFFVDRTHSEFIDILVTSGIFSFLAYLSLLLIICWRAIKYFVKSNVIFISTFVGFLSLVIFHSVNFSTTSSNVLLYLFMGYLVAFYAEDHNNVAA